MIVDEPQQPGQGVVVPPGQTAVLELDDPRIVQALEEYLEAIESGKKPNRQAFLARHATIAKALDGMEALNVAVSSSAGSATGETSAVAPVAGWQPGSVVEDFRIIREVGRGGMGVVFEAEQISLGRRIALKVLPFAFTLDNRQLQRFKNEARAAAQMHHSNIVPIYSVGGERGVHFYAMQYIEGQSLAEVIGELRTIANCQLPIADGKTNRQSAIGNRQLEDTAGGVGKSLATAFSTNGPGFFRSVAKLGLQAAEALEHAHAYGVVHRDVKPGNLMVEVGGHLWVTDFGLAQFQSDAALTRTGDLLGTLRYMSPEQALAKRGLVDHRTDIYSLGATLYELFTLEPPYNGQDREELLRQIAFEEPRPPRRWNPAVPADLETIVLKAMAKGVEDRYATAQELAEDLRCFLEHKPIRARRPSLVERTAKLARRHKAAVATAVGLLLLLAVGSLGSTALIWGEQRKTQTAYEQIAAEQARTKAALAGEQQKAREARKQRARAEKSFRQARETVDFLTQVAERELADHPFLTDLRRRLLETALVYYQSFLDERQNDPEDHPDLTDARERVAAILGELYASVGFGQMMFLTQLLGEQAVQKDLHFSEDQEEKTRNLGKGLSSKFAPSFSTFRDLRPEGRQKKFQEMTRAAEQSLATILTPGQVQRLKQIAMQQRGTQTWSDPEVAKVLELTDKQKQQIKTIQSEARKKMHRPSGPGKTPAGGPNQWDQDVNATNRRLLSVLSAAQQARWQEMIGKPFEGKIGQGFKGPFGPCHDGRPKGPVGRGGVRRPPGGVPSPNKPAPPPHDGR